MSLGVSARVMAAIFALSAFAIAVISGMAVGNPTQVVIRQALVSLAVCFVVGVAIGLVFEQVVSEHVERCKSVPKGAGTGESPVVKA
ncbi:MAG: hypothetical protein ACKVW3_12205 [Phycisphaerales bacterium]